MKQTSEDRMSVLPPLLARVFPTAHITLQERSPYGERTLSWEDGPSITQVRAICSHYTRELIYARCYSVEALTKIATNEFASWGMLCEGLEIGMQSDGATMNSHRTVMIPHGYGPITDAVMRSAGCTDLYTRPLEGLVLKETYPSMTDIISYQHPECFTFIRNHILTQEMMSGEPTKLFGGILQAIPLRDVPSDTLCDLIDCRCLMQEWSGIARHLHI